MEQIEVFERLSQLRADMEAAGEPLTGDHADMLYNVGLAFGLSPRDAGRLAGELPGVARAACVRCGREDLPLRAGVCGPLCPDCAREAAWERG